MRVICPKCQFENQADPNANRVVCARCATIIDVGMGLETSFGGGYGNTSTPGGTSGNYGGGGNFGGNYTGNYEQTIRPGAYPPAPPNRPQLPESDVYATRIDDDFDDVLDIPRPNTQLQSYQYNDNAPAFDDVFSTPGSYETMVDSRQPAAPPYQPDPYQGNVYQGNAYQQNNAYQANPYDNNPTFDSPNYGAPQQDPEFMGWPVLPEDTTDPGIPPTSAFSKKSNLLKAAAGLVIFGALALAAYSWIGSSGKKATPKTNPAVVVENPGEDPSQAAATTGTKPAASSTNGITGPAGIAVTTPPKEAVKPVNIPPAVAPTPASKAAAVATVLPPKETKVTPPKEAPKSVAPPVVASTTPNRGNITIQAGSFNDKAQADDKVNRLKAANESARVVAVNLPGKGTWYRVQIGRFGSREQAASYANQLRSKNVVQEFLVTPVN